MDGEELLSGQSPGPNVAVNTKGSIYIGKSQAWTPVQASGALPRTREGMGPPQS